MATQMQTVKVGDTSMNKVVCNGVICFKNAYISLLMLKCDSSGNLVSMPYHAYCTIASTSGLITDASLTWYMCNQNNVVKYGPFYSNSGIQYVGSWNWIRYTLTFKQDGTSVSVTNHVRVQNGTTPEPQTPSWNYAVRNLYV